MLNGGRFLRRDNRGLPKTSPHLSDLSYKQSLSKKRQINTQQKYRDPEFLLCISSFMSLLRTLFVRLKFVTPSCGTINTAVGQNDAAYYEPSSLDSLLFPKRQSLDFQIERVCRRQF